MEEYLKFTHAIDFYIHNFLFKNTIPKSARQYKKLYSKLEKQILILLLDQRRQIEEEYKKNNIVPVEMSKVMENNIKSINKKYL